MKMSKSVLDKMNIGDVGDSSSDDKIRISDLVKEVETNKDEEQTHEYGAELTVKDWDGHVIREALAPPSFGDASVTEDMDHSSLSLGSDNSLLMNNVMIPSSPIISRSGSRRGERRHRRLRHRRSIESPVVSGPDPSVNNTSVDSQVLRIAQSLGCDDDSSGGWITSYETPSAVKTSTVLGTKESPIINDERNAILEPKTLFKDVLMISRQDLVEVPPDDEKEEKQLRKESLPANNGGDPLIDGRDVHEKGEKKVSPMKKEDVSGFKSASGKQIKVSKESLDKAKLKMDSFRNNCDDSNENFKVGQVGFQSASGKNIVISKQALEAAKKKLETLSDKPFDRHKVELSKNPAD